MDVPYCIGRCKVCEFYQSCQHISQHLDEDY
jgi:hypothetical protein